MDIGAKAKEYFPYTVALRRDFHQYPELSDNVGRTSHIVEQELQKHGISYRIIDGQGILGVIDSGVEGRTVALRADMDALSIQELSDKEYRSKNAGIAHLCGHDCHTASLLTAARIINEEKENFTGKVHLIFQPAEEAPGCHAKAMIQNGAMDGVDAVFGIHMYNNIDVGTVSVQAGPRMAASLRATIEIKGIGSHGGSPHQGIDAIVAASAVVMNLQTIASRELDVLDSAVITVGTFHAGSSQFAVADKAELKLTVKFFNEKLRQQISESITRIAKDTAAAYRAECNVCIDGFLRPVVNDSKLADIAEHSVRMILGDKGVTTCSPWCASEDYGDYEVYAPGVFAFIGGRNESKGIIYPAHNPCFDVDEQSLEVASAVYAQFAIDYLRQME